MNKWFRIIPEAIIDVVFLVSGFALCGGLLIIFTKEIMLIPIMYLLSFNSRFLITLSPFLLLISIVAMKRIEFGKKQFKLKPIKGWDDC